MQRFKAPIISISGLQDASDRSFEVGFYKIEQEKKTIGNVRIIFRPRVLTL